MSSDTKEITQETVDQLVAEIREYWNELFVSSGKDRTIFLMTSKESKEILAKFAEVQEEVREQGLECPDLLEGVTVTVKDATIKCSQE